MALFPNTPLPSSVSAPSIIDPVLRYSSDQGIEIRRSRTSRPRRRYTLDYLGKTTTEMRTLRDFLLTCRLGALPFQWIHPTAGDVGALSNTTPVVMTVLHGLVTGQWIAMGGPHPLSGLWQITRLDIAHLALNGSSAAGVVADGAYAVYLPTAVAIFDQETWTAPTKLIGPEQTGGGPTRREGVFSWSLQIEETF